MTQVCVIYADGQVTKNRTGR